jgi:tRNA (guanine-N7-)-methyltransferase
MTTPERRRRLLYGRRKGPKLSAHQESLRATLLPRLRFTPEAGRDPASCFAAPVEDVWLEIGYGAGEHLLWQAKTHPRIGIIGAEPYIAGTAKLLGKLEHEAVGNVRLYEDDARDIIEALPERSLGRVFILFPDPWPKTRHHKRRFLQLETLDALARVLRDGAELRFASDDAGYVGYALERLMVHPAFRWTAIGPADWRNRTSDWPPTRYEAKEMHGAPAFLRFERTVRMAA